MKCLDLSSGRREEPRSTASASDESGKGGREAEEGSLCIRNEASVRYPYPPSKVVGNCLGPKSTERKVVRHVFAEHVLHPSRPKCSVCQSVCELNGH